MRLRRLLVVALAAVVFPSSSGVLARDLTFEERCSAQKAIEQVYWRHRNWPLENLQPKPLQDPALTDDRIRAMVDEDLRKSNALAQVWGQPVTAAQLQAEMERMAAQTRAPEMLREIFAALDDDPFLISETLVRRVLVDRLIRSKYDGDSRFHGDIRRRAEQALASALDIQDLRGSGAEYFETTWRRSSAERPFHKLEDEREYAPEEWSEALGRLEHALGSGSGMLQEDAPDDDPASPESDLPVGTMSPLQETTEGFEVAEVLWQKPGAIRVATALWRKTPFSTWWDHERQAIDGSLAATTGTFLLPAVAGTSLCAPDAWAPVLGQPEARTSHTAVWTGTEMLIWGGQHRSRLLDTGWRYNPSTDSWGPMSRGSAPAGRFGHIAVWTGGEMIVWGGFGTTWLGDGGRYDPTTDTWSPVSSASAPSRRQHHTGVWTGAVMIIWGGDLNGIYQDTGGRYDPVHDTWTATTRTGAPAAREGHTAVWTGTEMVVWGGYTGCCFQGNGARYRPDTDTWAPVPLSGAPSARTLHISVWTGSQVIVWGGTGNNGISTGGGRYTPATNSWQSMSDGPPGRFSPTATWTGSRMIVWGGVGGFNTPAVETGGRYDPSTDTWADTSSIGAPAGRVRHTAVWTGSDLIVWGGDNSLALRRYMDDGKRYDPLGDTWSAVSPGASPAGAWDHTSVWTGSEMIVWGGVGGDNLHAISVDSGGRYDPATDAWSPTSRVGAPTGRQEHTAVWTGTEMVVWGGISGNGRKRDGGRYNPALDAWTATTTEGAPSARSAHTAVWTGSEMIVWGGVSESLVVERLNSGGRYDPATDRWTSTSLSGAPAARSAHTAVWTGDEMIVWGGSNYDPFPNAGNGGGRYDPASDVWTPTTLTGAPSARYAHTAIWTGTEMIVWGGGSLGGVGPFALGARYRPATNVWLPVSEAGAGPQVSHTAVWTGSSMIAWGGGTNSGARYSPAADLWTPISSAGAPEARSSHTAIVSDTEMLVWGGESGAGTSFSDGGRYCTLTCASPTIWYQDKDGDGFGTLPTRLDCEQPVGFAAAAGDCDDDSSSIHPGALEECNGIDDDCNERIDDIAGCGNTAPHAVAEAPGTVECTSVDGAVVTLNGSASTDADSTPGTSDDIVSYTWLEAPGQPGETLLGTRPVLSVTLSLGAHSIGLVVADREGATDKTTIIVVVRDTTAPEFSVWAHPPQLWPPNHEMVPVSIAWRAVDLCDPSPAVVLVAAGSSEPDDAPGPGDGETPGDIAGADLGSPDEALAVRAERDGAGPGRMYELTYAAMDASGNTTPAFTVLTVPHDQRSGPEPLILRLEHTSFPLIGKKSFTLPRTVNDTSQM